VGALALFARCFAIGVAIAAPVGAMGALCIGRTLRGGPRYGLATGLGIASADAMYGAVAAFGLTAVSSLLTAWTVPLRIAGGLVLLALGTRAFLAAPPAQDASCAPEPPLKLYASAMLLTLTNPTTIIEFGVIFASAGLVATGGRLSLALAATLGIASGSLAWWLVLVTGISLGRARVGSRTLALVNRVSGVVIGGFGVAVLASLLLR
jgi:threonine/homoserine/homoserine lactone efflux protein